jgi:trehalose 6-phosphate synthase
MKQEIEQSVGRIVGGYGDVHWTPLIYQYRNLSLEEIVVMYRLCDVALITPLRDGMNLVAKEFVAAQDPACPGVLVLSRFAGAAAELVDAVLTNPYHVDSLARDLDGALRMPAEERMARHARLLSIVARTTALTWAEAYLGTLLACRGDAGPGAVEPGSEPV